jgi:hypothetical protein
MLNKEDFIKFIVDGPQAVAEATTKQKEPDSALPNGFDGFETDAETSSSDSSDSSFAHNLMIASGFGNPEHIERSEVILNSDAAAKHLPNLVYYWPKNDDRPYQTLLFELEQPGTVVLTTKLFKSIGKQKILEDALSRFVQHTLRGFEKGGEKRTASVRQGKQTETLCIVSVQDDRNKDNETTHLVCFGTKNAANDSLESFHIREEAKSWEPQIRNEHLNRLYERHFKKLISNKWQNAFISIEERKLAHKLLDICINDKTTEHDIEQGVVALLEEIAGSYGLRRKGGKTGKRLKSFSLPKNHDIGGDSESRKTEDGQNPFKGMTLRDENNHLLGYIIYCLDEKKDAEQLRSYLQKNNRFHNVLVIYPDGDHAELELWQGKIQLSGKLKKDGAQYKGEGEVVNLLSRFFVVSKSNIENPVELAEELAFRARYLRKLVLKEIYIENKKETGPILELYHYFTKALAKQTFEEFSDNYAQTITYGLLAARWITKNRKERFTSKNVVKYLPNTSPFLKKLFSKLIGLRISPKLFWLIEDIVSLLDRIHVKKVFSATKKEIEIFNDPVIHFYEDFLDAYDPQIRTDRGVYYTPDSVVKNIVTSCDKSLQENFLLPLGIADSCSWEDISKKLNRKIPNGITAATKFVQILDPATGTGTFLKHIIELIFHRMMGVWKNEGLSNKQCTEKWILFVRKNLLPRLHAFEIMMAPFIVCHLRLGLLFQETGFTFEKDDKLNVYLTNTLENNSHIVQLDLFEDWMAKESEEAHKIKKTKHINVILGNPPYNVKSKNKGAWIKNILKEYKKGLNEKKLNLDDDYVKFWRFAQWIIEQNGIWGGIIGYITPHGWLDAPTFRGMRNYFLLKHDVIHLIDLHGNTTKIEKTPQSLLKKYGQDENVFNIKQGVCIAICTSNLSVLKKKEQADVKWVELWGERIGKYKQLSTSKFSMTNLQPKAKMFLFIPFDSSLEEKFMSGWSIKDIFSVSGNGIKTERDRVTIHFDKNSLLATIDDFILLKESEIREKYKLYKDSRDWGVQRAKEDIRKNGKDLIAKIFYRPFDNRYSWYSGKGKGFIGTPGYKTQQHLLYNDLGNIALVATRQQSGNTGFSHVWATKNLTECCAISNRTREINSIFPLYQIEHASTKKNDLKTKHNFVNAFIKEFSKKTKLKFVESLPGSEGDDFKSIWTPLDFFHYLYGVLHDPNYRNNYEGLLRRSFPIIPLPSEKDLNTARFYKLNGKNLLKLHLDGTTIKSINDINFASENVESIIMAGHPKYDKNKMRIYINNSDFFDRISPKIWDFFIGGYQPAQKWLKDRKGRKLTHQECQQYIRNLIVISKTIEIMDNINKNFRSNSKLF